jgi:peptidoglycan/xylan/chitin deacetylase (PgdA/CDA1 family)
LPVYFGCRNQRTVALTFDDGPTSETLQLLNVLKAYGIKATFFVLGILIRDNYQRSIIRQIAADGHLIASHGYSHTSVYSLDNYRISQELQNTANSIREASGITPQHFRPPYGDISDATGAYIRSLGYRIVKWNVDPIDWRSDATPQSIADRVRNEVRANNGGIVLMHDIYSRTNQALPSIINFLRSESFNIVRLDECL